MGSIPLISTKVVWVFHYSVENKENPKVVWGLRDDYDLPPCFGFMGLGQVKCIHSYSSIHHEVLEVT